jgi:DNA-binding transcriptional MerR regulator
MDAAMGMTIGEAAARAGVPPKTIRFYESIGLIAPARRTANRYRAYDEDAVRRLRFIARARGLGFALKEVAALLALYGDRGGRATTSSAWRWTRSRRSTARSPSWRRSAPRLPISPSAATATTGRSARFSTSSRRRTTNCRFDLADRATMLASWAGASRTPLARRDSRWRVASRGDG